jgi:hypothetical protein
MILINSNFIPPHFYPVLAFDILYPSSYTASAMNSRLVEPEIANLPNRDTTEPARNNTGDQQSTSSPLSLSPTKDANGTIASTRDEYVQKL